MYDDYAQDTPTTDETRDGARDLGDITDLVRPRFPKASLDGNVDRIDYFKFTLTEAKRVGLGLRRQDADADLYLEDAHGNVLYSSTKNGTANEWIGQTLVAGTYYVRVEAQEVGDNDFKLRYGVREPDPNEAPEFAETSYSFDLAENTDGSTTTAALGSVSATDPEAGTVTYSIEGGNADGLFAIDASTGALSYQGTGEDYESGTTSHALTVRASDGSLHSNVTVTVNVTGAAEAPGFAETSYSFDLAENTDGSTTAVALGSVLATDPEAGTVTYSIEGGNADGLFAIDASTGALSYQGTGEDYESGTTSHALTVRASDGSLHSDTTVTVNVTAADAAPAFAEPSYSFDLAENTDGSATAVALGSVSATDPEAGTVTYSIEGGNSDGLFEIDSSTGALSYKSTGENYESGTTSYTLTVRASDGSLHSDVTVTVNVTDAAEAPVFAESSYAFNLMENTDGSATAAALGSVSATDPEAGTVTYSIESGNSDGLFEIDSSTGALSYKGTGEEYDPGTTVSTFNIQTLVRSEVYEPGDNSHEVTIRASDGSLHSDVTVSVNVVPQSVSEPDGGDLSADSSTTGRVAVGDTVTGTIETSDDHDWFAVELEAGQTYGIEVRGPSTSTGYVFLQWREPYLHGIYDADSNLISGTSSDDGRLSFTATESGTHYIAAGAGDGVGAYSYELEVKQIEDDFAASTETTGTVVVDDSATGNIELAGDEDWFAAELEEGKLYVVDIKGLINNSEPLHDPYLRGIYDSDGNFISDTSDNNGGYRLNSQLYFSPSATGTYYIAATGLGGDGTYVVEVTETEVEDDYAASVDTTGTVEVDGFATGEIDYKRDKDWFAVEFEEGRTYFIDFRPSDTGTRALNYAYAKGVYDANGDLIARNALNDGNGHASWSIFTAESAGTHYIEATGAKYQTGAYELNVTAGEDIKVGESTTGTIETAAARDLFVVELEAGKTYQFDMEVAGTGGGGSVSGWPYISRIYKSDGKGVPGTHDGIPYSSAKSQVWFTPEEAGTYIVMASNRNGDWTGDYTFRVSEIADDFLATVDTSGTVEVGGTATGNIEYADDRDWFAVELEAGKTYQIDTSGTITGGGTLRWGRLDGVYDADGNVIHGVRDLVSIGETYTFDGVQTHPGEDAQVFFTPSKGGTYYLAASNLNGNTGTYTVEVTEINDDFPATVSTTGTVEVGGTTTGEIEYEGDRDWFAVELTARETYKIELLGRRSDSVDQNLHGPRIWGIRDSHGFARSGKADYDSNSRVFFTPDEDGTYYVAAGNYVSGIRDEDVGTYTLQVSVDDFGDDTDTTGTVSVGGSVTGEIEAQGDRDWFAVTLEAGKTYQFDMEGSETDGGTLENPLLHYMRDADGDYLRDENGWKIHSTADQDSGEGGNARATFTPDEDGTYFVVAGSGGHLQAADSHGRSLGTYTLSVEEVVDAI